MALGFQKRNLKNRIFCLLGDGECDEGSVWEALRTASILKVPNLHIIIDFNKLQGYKIKNESTKNELLINMLKSLNLDYYEFDGNSFEEISKTFKEISNKKKNKSKILLAHTLKGKGVSFMEDKLKWHYKSPNEEELNKAMNELK